MSNDNRVIASISHIMVSYTANKSDAMNQLKLALAWNRIDVVKEEIFTDDKTWDVSNEFHFAS